MTADGRFAPSPTGTLHVGNLRTALLAWLFARSAGARYLVRMEDLDHGRVQAGAATRQLEDLGAIGLDWDGEVVWQSHRHHAYEAAIESLQAAGDLYECFCTRAEIRAAASAPHEPLPEGAYPGTCLRLTEAERRRKRAGGRPPALRIRAAAARVAFTDRLHGEVEGVVDDFVVRRNDRTPAYNLAVVVDDAWQGIGEVVRGDDLLDTTPRQVFLAGRLGLPVARLRARPARPRAGRRAARQAPRRRHAGRARRGRRGALDGRHARHARGRHRDRDARGLRPGPAPPRTDALVARNADSETVASVMLVGRDQERARIDRLLGDALAGRSGALLLVGEAGIGKTALLEHARAAAVAAGMPILRARGMQTETDIPFAGLSELLGPLLDRLDAIPPTQAAALRGALALGDATGGDRYAVMAGVLSLLAAAAEEQPLLALVDDCQWLDDSSLEALLFAGRRLGAEGIVLLGSYRGGTVPIGPWLERLEIGPLGPEEARALLEQAQGTRLALPVAERLVAGTGGNPLALLEVPTLLTDAQLEGREPLASPLRPGAGIKAAFRRRVEQLPEDGQRALLVAAAAENGALDAIMGALEVLGLDASALEPAEAAGLIRLETGRLDFRHPLLRSTAYYTASALDRRIVHRALADVAAPGSAGRAWHLASATIAPDEDVAAALEAAGLEARRRGAPGHRGARPRAGGGAVAGQRRAGAALPRGGERRGRDRRGRAGARLPAGGRGPRHRRVHRLRDPAPAGEHPDPHRARPGRLPRPDRRGGRRARHRRAARRRDVPRGVDLPHEHRRHGGADQRRRPGARGGRGARSGARAARGDRDRRGVPRARGAQRRRGAAADRRAVPARRRPDAGAAGGARHGRALLDLGRGVRPRGGDPLAARPHLPRRERRRRADLPARRAGAPRPAARALEPGGGRGGRVARARRADRPDRAPLVQHGHAGARARAPRPRGGHPRGAHGRVRDDRADAGRRRRRVRDRGARAPRAEPRAGDGGGRGARAARGR